MGATGLEPVTSTMSTWHSSQLSYAPYAARAQQPADKLPRQERRCIRAGPLRSALLPARIAAAIRAAKRLASPAQPPSVLGRDYPRTARPPVSTPGRTRTPNPLIRSQVLYPIELRALCESRLALNSAHDRTRTCTSFRTLVPQTSLSTNSSTWATSFLHIVLGEGLEPSRG